MDKRFGLLRELHRVIIVLYVSFRASETCLNGHISIYVGNECLIVTILHFANDILLIYYFFLDFFSFTAMKDSFCRVLSPMGETSCVPPSIQANNQSANTSSIWWFGTKGECLMKPLLIPPLLIPPQMEFQ